MFRRAALAFAIFVGSLASLAGCNDLTKPNEMKVVKEAPKPKAAAQATSGAAIATASPGDQAARPPVPPRPTAALSGSAAPNANVASASVAPKSSAAPSAKPSAKPAGSTKPVGGQKPAGTYD